VPTSSRLYFEAGDVLAFLGRKLTGLTEQIDFSQMPKRFRGGA